MHACMHACKVNHILHSSCTQKKKWKLRKIIIERRKLEHTLEQWRLEETEMAKQTTMLSSQREMKAREATKVRVSLLFYHCRV